jgi:hypothetical protein
MMRSGIALLTVAALLGSATSAYSMDDAKVRCAAAYEQAQQLRRQDRLLSARAQLLICKETCSAAFAQDCERWRSEVDTLLPTVRLRPLDANGQPLAAVRVFIDGLLLEDVKVGAPLQVDAGEHTFRFESPPLKPIQVRVALHGGERERDVSVMLKPESAAGDEGGEGETKMRPPTAATYIFGAVSLIGFGVAGGLSLKGHLDYSERKDACAPRCTQGDVDSIFGIYRAAWISAGVGAAALVGAILVWRPWERVAVKQESAGFFVAPSLTGVAVGMGLYLPARQ